ncbi:MAG: hypothetical protein ACI865_002570 [Flavobacteriaceae bacterium]|jgi:hypothetical protein
MARVQIYPEQEIARINHLFSRLENYRDVNHDLLIRRSTERSWSVIEVVKHMVLAHNAYCEKIETTVVKLGDIEGTCDSVKANFLPSSLIKRFPPKDKKINFKMKTMKGFQPVFEAEDFNKVDSNELFDEFAKTLSQLKGWVEIYRMKNVTSIRFNSAIGAIVKFNSAEACEFILCHCERHFQQIDNVLNSSQK